jgi:hypothetical protein
VRGLRPVLRRPAPEGTPERERGQGLVEFTFAIPLLLILLAGVVEVGLIANDALTIGYGSREGARAGSALARGGVVDCAGGNDPSGVDAAVVAGVQRIIESSGSAVELDEIDQIRIFKSTASGAVIGNRVNVWTYAGPGLGPDVDPGPGVSNLDFVETSVTWPACSRVNAGGTPDILGVEVSYDRELVSHLASVLSTFGLAPVVTLTETTVMTLNPSF